MCAAAAGFRVLMCLAWDPGIEIFVVNIRSMNILARENFQPYIRYTVSQVNSTLLHCAYVLINAHFFPIALSPTVRVLGSTILYNTSNSASEHVAIV